MYIFNIYATDIINLCQSNKHINQLCDYNFWKMKINHDYPIVKLKSLDYKQEYLVLTKLYYKAADIGNKYNFNIILKL